MPEEVICQSVAGDFCREWVCLYSVNVYVCLYVAFWGHFLFALIPSVAQAFQSLSAISPLPCSEEKDRTKHLMYLI